MKSFVYNLPYIGFKKVEHNPTMNQWT